MWPNRIIIIIIGTGAKSESDLAIHEEPTGVVVYRGFRVF
jgi:hypothetical protein